MPLSGKEMLRLLLSRGWIVVRIRGSHHWVEHPDLPGQGFPVPVHGNRSLGVGLEKRIFQLAGITRGPDGGIK
jgi:predicted RNA binding protein YcfA (HicA-like mRNA interferase family)